ncbi:hypothetical protein H0H93_013795 [Arthromyces matolae]|nr:hypothetical protein H0H93_013795 [Arthromyces matolae]
MMEEPTRDGSFDVLPEVDREEEEEEEEYDNSPAAIIKDGQGEEGLSPLSGWTSASDGWNWSSQGYHHQDGSNSKFKTGYGLDSASPSSPSFPNPHPHPNPNPHPLASPRWYQHHQHHEHQQHQQQHQPWDTDSTIQAGDSIHTTPATPISPSQLMFVRSTESSLAGWDGSNMGLGLGFVSGSVGAGVAGGGGAQVPPSSSACGGSTSSSSSSSATNPNAGAGAGAGVAWGSSVQRVGVQDWSRGWG